MAEDNENNDEDGPTQRRPSSHDASSSLSPEDIDEGNGNNPTLADSMKDTASEIGTEVKKQGGVALDIFFKALDKVLDVLDPVINAILNALLKVANDPFWDRL